MFLLGVVWYRFGWALIHVSFIFFFGEDVIRWEGFTYTCKLLSNLHNAQIQETMIYTIILCKFHTGLYMIHTFITAILNCPRAS